MGALLILLVVVPFLGMAAVGVARSMRGLRPVDVKALPASLAAELGGELGPRGEARIEVDGVPLEVRVQAGEQPDVPVVEVTAPRALWPEQGQLRIRPPLMVPVGDVRDVLRVSSSSDALRARFLDDPKVLAALAPLLPHGQDAEVRVEHGDLVAVFPEVPPYPPAIAAAAGQVRRLVAALRAP